ncbi:hypothetical protein SLEP1_g50190 [Rubroshorea leprosula]|uniref:Uncharacterized protein n=1 Tax=Rubroshorea leprosula TaxID=152421 RepID=A0AAV5M003_9ROSI|nr:hypothetical protein SLEP1_g50190 [Rubroshorea leprosula]
MDTVKEDELYRYRVVKLPSLMPSILEAELEPELEGETGQRRRSRDILIAVDQGPKQQGAHDANHGLMERLAVEASQIAMVKCVARIVEGDAGKVICQEAERIKPAAVVVALWAPVAQA